jgi:hypothetical protein
MDQFLGYYYLPLNLYDFMQYKAILIAVTFFFFKIFFHNLGADIIISLTSIIAGIHIQIPNLQNIRKNPKSSLLHLQRHPCFLNILNTSSSTL